jgi:hypothetical protein
MLVQASSNLVKGPQRQTARVVIRMSQNNIIYDAPKAIEIAGSARTVAVLGIKTENHASQPAYHVPEYCQVSHVIAG